MCEEGEDFFPALRYHAGYGDHDTPCNCKEASWPVGQHLTAFVSVPPPPAMQLLLTGPARPPSFPPGRTPARTSRSPCSSPCHATSAGAVQRGAQARAVCHYIFPARSALKSRVIDAKSLLPCSPVCLFPQPLMPPSPRPPVPPSPPRVATGSCSPGSFMPPPPRPSLSSPGPLCHTSSQSAPPPPPYLHLKTIVHALINSCNELLEHPSHGSIGLHVLYPDKTPVAVAGADAMGRL